MSRVRVADARYERAPTHQEMARILNQNLVRLELLMDPLFEPGILSEKLRGDVKCRPGVLVQINNNGTATAADSSLGIAASAVVLSVDANQMATVAPLARINVALGGTPTSNRAPLWLGNNGIITRNQPTGSIAQLVGYEWSYNGSTGLSECLIFPGISSLSTIWSGLLQPLTTSTPLNGGPYDGSAAVTFGLDVPLLTTYGGTGLAAWTQGDIPYYTSGTALSQLAKSTNATRYISNTGTNNAPAWAQVNLTNGVSGVLPIANGGTNKALTLAAGAVVWTDADSFEVTAAGSSGQLLTSNGTSAPSWTTATFPSTAGATGTILQSNGTNWVASTPTWPTSASTAGKVVRSDGTNLVMSTPTFSNSATSGTVLRGDGTNWLNSSFTIPDTAAQGDIIYASASNVYSTLAKDANATRYLSNQGSSNSPSWNQVNLANGVTGTLVTTNGGTGLSSWTQGDIPYYVSGTALSQLAKNTTATRYISNTGTNNAPAWAQIDLSNGITGVVPIANGGTNNSSAYSAGSVIFSDGTKLTQDNNNLYFDDTNDQLKIGLGAVDTSDLATLTAYGDQSNIVTGIFDNGTAVNDLVMNCNRSAGAGGNVLLMKRSHGTSRTSLTIVNNGDQLIQITGQGYDGAAYRSGCSIIGLVDGSPGSSDMPGRLEFHTTPDASATLARRMVVTQSGVVIIGDSSTPSGISDGAGDLQVEDELQVKGNADVDGTLVVDGNATFSGNTTLDTGSGESVLRQIPGAASNYVDIGGISKVNLTTVGNVGGGTDDLMTYTLGGGFLATAGESLRFMVAGACAANGNAKTINVVFGGTTLITMAGGNGGSWQAWGAVFYDTGTTQRGIATISYTTAAGATTSKTTYTTPGETASGTITFKCTAAGTNDNDITQTIEQVEWLPAQ